MMTVKQDPCVARRLLVKIRPSSLLKAAAPRLHLQPLLDTPQAQSALLGIGAEPQWFVAEQPATSANPWDIAHADVAGELGLAPSDVLFAEPDWIHNAFPNADEIDTGKTFSVGATRKSIPQDDGHGKAGVPGVFAWHLGDDYSQLGKARDAVQFSNPRTRIAHLDTGYYRAHCTTPEYILHALERNFVAGEANGNSSEDPGPQNLLDNSGHGTGTLGILAGGKVPDFGNVYLGGAPGAEILPLRVARSVVLLCTSSIVRALDYALLHHCDVVTMSMGGLPSRAWREAVDRAYLGGLCLVAAAGNNINGMPTRHIVYPARYGRVIAVCGVMADSRAYEGLQGLTTLEGNYGPDSQMASALAAYTPNIPWACFGDKTAVRLNGEGTSAATPQVAAAVALWFEKYKQELPRSWQRIEAVRHALFKSAKGRQTDRQKLGNGILQAYDALRVKPVWGLPQTKSDDDSFAFLRVMTGLGLAAATPREKMFNLEIAQRFLLNRTLSQIVPDPDTAALPDTQTLQKVMEALIDDEGASQALRKHLEARYPLVVRKPARRPTIAKSGVKLTKAFAQPQMPVGAPPYRRLRVYAVDPSLSTRLETAGIHEATLKVRWETVEKGPAGKYLAVEDTDDAGKTYPPVDLDHPCLLAQDGWAPSEGNAQFHQQMVYAVAMKTIEHFETALGRPVLWRPKPNPQNPNDDGTFVDQLTIRPHALHQANAYYSPQEIALLFGYFDASADDPANHMPGSRIFSCLSYDIIAHETTHAILDGMHGRFNEPSNPDVLALHEAFADIIALMQHFTVGEILEHEIRRTRGDIEAESLLGGLALQFGRATGGRGALRNAIGFVQDGKWQRLEPDPADYSKRLTPHARGAVLVAAVFDAFIAIYKQRIADLLRISTNGTGILSQGAILPDLARRLAGEAVKSAKHVLNICIRALDYLPPVDVTFFEYLRALITADFDLVADDAHHYRVAFVEAFRRRGIYPVNIDTPSADTIRTLSVDTLRWQGLDHSALSSADRNHYTDIIRDLKRFSDACFYMQNRRDLFEQTRRQRRRLHAQLQKAFAAAPTFAAELGLDPQQKSFEVHELRRALRVGPDGKHIPQIIVALTQSKKMNADKKKGIPEYLFRGGSTLIIDLTAQKVQYRIFKSIGSKTRRARTETFIRETAADPLRALFLAGGHNEPFAVLHTLDE